MITAPTIRILFDIWHATNAVYLLTYLLTYSAWRDEDTLVRFITHVDIHCQERGTANHSGQSVINVLNLITTCQSMIIIIIIGIVKKLYASVWIFLLFFFIVSSVVRERKRNFFLQKSVLVKNLWISLANLSPQQSGSLSRPM